MPHEDIINKAGEVREVTGADNEIWCFGQEAYEIMKHFIEVRESMRDYSRSLMEEASSSGTPVIRALFYEFPQDEKAWTITDEYRYGPKILVAPVCHQGQVKRKVYLPAGSSWEDSFSGEEYSGGQEIMVDAPLERIPVFNRKK